METAPVGQIQHRRRKKTLDIQHITFLSLSRMIQLPPEIRI